jgi:hypothetical protein
MASGETLLVFDPRNAEPVGTSNQAVFTVRNNHLGLAFDDSTVESIGFHGKLPQHYSGGGVTVYLHWAAASATSGDTYWRVYWERIGSEVQDLDSDGFASAQGSADTTSGTSGYVVVHSVAFTDGAQMDSTTAGDEFRIKVDRFASDAGDTMSGDAELYCVEIRET